MNSKMHAPALILLLASAPLFADTRSMDIEVTISAVPDEVLRAFLDGDDLKAWWKVSRSLIKPKEGGVCSITWDDWGAEKTRHSWTGVIEEITPNKLVIGRLLMNEPNMPLLGPLQIEVSVAPTNGGTMLSLSHRGYGYGEHWDTRCGLVVQGWDHVLGDPESWIQEGY